MGHKVSKLTLDMLRIEMPMEMTVDDEGNVTNDGRGEGFRLDDVKKELVETARKIAHDFEHEFGTSDDDGTCRFCGFKFYCAKW